MNRFTYPESEDILNKIPGHKLSTVMPLPVIHSDHLIWLSIQGD